MFDLAKFFAPATGACRHAGDTLRASTSRTGLVVVMQRE
jgi:hypothetical protein